MILFTSIVICTRWKKQVRGCSGVVADSIRLAFRWMQKTNKGGCQSIPFVGVCLRCKSELAYNITSNVLPEIDLEEKYGISNSPIQKVFDLFVSSYSSSWLPDFQLFFWGGGGGVRCVLDQNSNMDGLKLVHKVILWNFRSKIKQYFKVQPLYKKTVEEEILVGMSTKNLRSWICWDRNFCESSMMYQLKKSFARIVVRLLWIIVHLLAKAWLLHFDDQTQYLYQCWECYHSQIAVHCLCLANVIEPPRNIPCEVHSEMW